MDIYKRFGISSSFLDAIQSVTEKKALDPVDPKQAKGAFQNRKDKDIDNDGKVTGTDKYLHARRNAITKAMSEKKKGGKDQIDTKPKIDDKEGMRGVQEAERRADAKVVKVRNPDGTMSFRKERPEIKVEEVEEIDELSKETLKSYVQGAKQDVAQRKKAFKSSSTLPPQASRKQYNRLRGMHTATNKMDEEVEEIDELSKSTLGSYVKKRVKQVPNIEIGRQMAEPGRQLRGYEKLKKKVNKGISRAVDRLAKEEVEEIDELSKGTLASYAKKASRDARIKMATGKDFERHAITSRKPEYKQGAKDWEDKYKSDARRREAGVNKAIDRLAKEEVEEGVKSGLENPHNCATHVYSEQWGDGTPIKTMHAEPDEYGDIAWYDVMFDHGIEKHVPIEELKVVRSEAHIHSSKKPKNEASKVDELDKKTLDKYSTRARFSSNPKHREGALKAMDKIKNKSKNEK